jgi:hypothetical protein
MRMLVGAAFAAWLGFVVVACSGSEAGTSCGPGQTLCGDLCVDLQSDRANCGGCGLACAAGQNCNGAGVCEVSCQAGLVNCGGKCIDPKQDRNFCGAKDDCQAANAGKACAAGEVCNGTGVCETSCQEGLIACGGKCIDPKQDRNFCGATGDCQGANAGSVCASGRICNGAGVCDLSCQPSLLDCNGTCVDPQSNPSFCGATGDCAGANAGKACAATEACSAGVCATTVSTFKGPQTNVSISSLKGWSTCFVQAYGTYGTTLASIKAACTGTDLMLGCRTSGSDTLLVAAHAPRDDVFFDTSAATNTPHVANGSGWYFDDSLSWGFALEGDPILRVSCDIETTHPEQRLCWHTTGSALSSGWRCGATTDLNSTASYERVILETTR